MRRYSGGHVVAIGVTVMTLCFGGAVLALDHQMPRYFGLSGTVVSSSTGTGQIEVAYRDGQGAERSVRFAVVDPALFIPGDRFGLLLLMPAGTIYPEEPYTQHVRGVPAAPALDTAPRDTRVALLVIGALLLAGWAVRAYFTASATDAPATRARARHRTPFGDEDAGAGNTLLSRHLIQLTPAGPGGPRTPLQPVSWSPDLERLVGRLRGPHSHSVAVGLRVEPSGGVRAAARPG
ncbi:hypothetical protein [Herbidospora cretacea]|uniref:hypothetical protein n=1 Tax=Herbidospora cretacea TaxID=28444 RepID=UPI0004C32F33|nr:hypothetical protein [Herbidospora cretacea]